MSSRHPVAQRARLGMDKMPTEPYIRVPRVRVMTIDGVRGVWVPLHPLAVVQRNKP